MRIGINALALAGSVHGGARTYLKGLVEALQAVDRENQYWIFANDYSARVLQPVSANFRLVHLPLSAENRPRRVLTEQLSLPGYAERLQLDVLHSPMQLAPLRARCASVVTIHDLHYLYPELARRWDLGRRLLYQVLVPRSVRRAARVIAVSRFTARDLTDKLQVAPSRIVTVYEGVDHAVFHNRADERQCAETRQRYGLGKDFALCVGGFGPHKNTETVGRAMDICRDKHGLDMQLVVAGTQSAFSPEWSSKIAAQSPNRRHYNFPGHVSPDSLACFYRMARVFVFTSLFEGFGLPLLEAFACGCPVVCSNRAALPEVAGGAAFLVDPLNPEQIAAAIVKVCTTPGLRDQLVSLGLRRAGEFSWERAASETVAVYRLAALEHERGRTNHRRAPGG